MQTSVMTQLTTHAAIADMKHLEGDLYGGYRIDPITLAYLDFGLFKSLCKLDVSRERICAALTISFEDFDYLRKLSMM